MRYLIITILLAGIATGCAKKTVPETSIKGVSKFQLSGGAAISQPGTDEYNPQVVKMPDGYLVLVFGSDRSCGSCSGHNLFVARSTAPYNNDAVFPAFATPVVFTVTGNPINLASAVNFAGAASGSNLRIYLNNAGGVIQFGDISPTGSYNVAALSAITNTTWQNSTIVGVDAGGTTLYTKTGGALYAVNPSGNTPTLTAMTVGGSATSLTNIHSNFSNRSDGFFSLVSGSVEGMSPYGTGGKLDSVNKAVAKAKISARRLSILSTGVRSGDLMFISGIESGSSTQDMYVVDGLSVATMWEQIDPKPPSQPSSGSGSSGTSNLTWSYGTLPATTNWKSIAYGSGTFVALSSSTTAAATSFDGVLWTSRTLPSTGWVSVTYGNGVFVAVASSVGTSAMTSPDGITWTTRTLATNFWSSVTFANNKFVAVAQAGTVAATSPDGITWTAQTLPASANWSSVTYGGGLYVAVANGTNQAATSPDGITWTARTMPSSGAWSSVSYGNGIFVAVRSGTVSATSPDGINWTSRTINSSTWNSVSYGNGTFVAVGSGGPSYAVSSADGITWSDMSLGVAVNGSAVTFGSGFFAAVNNGTLNAASTAIANSFPTYSPVVGIFNSAQNVTISTTTAGAILCYTTDGVTTPACDATPICTAGSTYSSPINIAATTTLKAAACKNGMATSSTTGTFNIDTTPPVISSVSPATSANIGSAMVSYTLSEGVASGNVTFTQTSGTIDGGSPHVQALTGAELNTGAHNSITLTNNPTLIAGSVYTVTFNATDFAGNSATPITRTNVTFIPGSTWTNRTLPNSVNWSAVTYANNIFVAVASASNFAASSPNGTTWTARTLPSTSNWSSVAYGNGIFIAVASSTTAAAISTDGLTWTATAMPSGASWNDITFGNGVFVAIASGGSTAATSTDGITWNPGTLPGSYNWRSVAYGNNTFVAVAYGTDVAATSTDGITWMGRIMPVNTVWYSVTYGNGVFAAVAAGSSSAATSADGITWAGGNLPTSDYWYAVTYGNGVFVAVGSNPGSKAATSLDGLVWTARTLPTTATWFSVAYGNGIFAAVGWGTAAATSP